MRISDWSSDVCSSDLPALVLAEQFAGAADFQVVVGQGEAGAELVHRGDRVQPLARVRTDQTLVRDHQVGVSAMVRAPDAPAQLVQLRQAEAVAAVDVYGVEFGLASGR